MSYAISTTVPKPYAETVEAVKAALADQGFGVLTEIDMQATMKEKLNVDIPAQVILGACRPPLAYASLQAEPSIGLLLPCNVVVREAQDGTVVEAVDPEPMVEMSKNSDLQAVADEAKQRLQQALAALSA